ncbi:MAG: hypothetical protein CSA72_10430 [Rhodobacterales bacterium]|nr:MAG: hypothetical protein CSA72_10430 [Rhodobacterales bacterium]
MTETDMNQINALAEAATNSGREMAVELGNRFGVKRLVEIWEQHNVDVRAWHGAVKADYEARIEALEAQLAEATRSQIAVTSEMQERFEAWFVQNYPGPNTVIHNPHCHAPQVFRAALHCVSKDGSEKAIAEAERRGAERMRERAADEVLVLTMDPDTPAQTTDPIVVFEAIRALPLTEGGDA